MTDVAGSPLGTKPKSLDEDASASIHGRSSPMFAVFNFTKTMVGAGVFTAPHAMLISGYFAFIVILIIASIIMYITCKVIMGLGMRYNLHTYRSVCHRVIGKYGGIVEASASSLLTFGAMVSYGLLIADSLPPLFVSISGWDVNALENKGPNANAAGIGAARVFLDRRIMLTLATVLIMLPLVMLPDMHFLSYSSMFGLFCFLIIAVCLSQRALSMPQEGRGTLEGGSLMSVAIAGGIPNAIARAAFMNICQHAQFVIFNSLEKNTNTNRKKVIISSLSLSTLAVVTFGSLTYIPLNDKISGNIFNSFSYDDVLVNVCRLALSFHIMASYPLQAHVCRIVLHSLISGENAVFTAKKRVIYSGLITLASWAIAVAVCDLGVIVDITGGVAAGTLSFVLPGILWIANARKDRVSSKVKYIPATLLLIAGLALVLYTIVNEIYTAATAVGGSKCVYRFL